MKLLITICLAVSAYSQTTPTPIPSLPPAPTAQQMSTTLVTLRAKTTTLLAQLKAAKDSLVAKDAELASVRAELAAAKSTCVIVPPDWVTALNGMIDDLNAANIALWTPGSSRLLFVGVMPSTEFDQPIPFFKTIPAR